MAANKNKPMQDNNKLQPEQWILLLGLLLFVGLITTALIPDSPDQKRVVQQQSSLQSPARPAVQGQAVARLRQFTPVQPHAYQGRIDKVINRDPGGWGQIHILLSDNAGNRQEISLAPVWYLEFQGCFLKVGQQVDGEFFRFHRGQQAGGFDYAKSVIVNGTRCRLRSVDGFSLWSDQLQ